MTSTAAILVTSVPLSLGIMSFDSLEIESWKQFAAPVSLFSGQRSANGQATGVARSGKHIIVSGFGYYAHDRALGWLVRLDPDTHEAQPISINGLPGIQDARLLGVAADERSLVAVGDDWTLVIGDGAAAETVEIQWDNPLTPEVESKPPPVPYGCARRSLFYALGQPAFHTFRAVDMAEGVAFAAGCSGVIIRIEALTRRATRIFLPHELEYPSRENSHAVEVAAVRAFSASEVAFLSSQNRRLNSAGHLIHMAITRGSALSADPYSFHAIDSPAPVPVDGIVAVTELLGASKNSLLGVFVSDQPSIHGLMADMSLDAPQNPFVLEHSEFFTSAGLEKESGRVLVGATYGRLFFGEPN